MNSARYPSLSVPRNFDALAIAIFRAPANAPLSATAAIMAVAVIAAVSIFILDRRVRPLDAVT